MTGSRKSSCGPYDDLPSLVMGDGDRVPGPSGQRGPWLRVRRQKFHEVPNSGHPNKCRVGSLNLPDSIRVACTAGGFQRSEEGNVVPGRDPPLSHGPSSVAMPSGPEVAQQSVTSCLPAGCLELVWGSQTPSSVSQQADPALESMKQAPTGALGSTDLIETGRAP